jgi:hypothetical protein
VTDGVRSSEPLVIYAGDDEPITFTLTSNGAPVSLDGYSARAQVRDRADSTTVLHEWTTDDGTAEFSTQDSTVSLNVIDSESWTWRSGVYDLHVTDFAGRTKIVDRRPVVVIPAVTHG